MEGSFELWVMCGSFVLLLVLGVPVAFAIGFRPGGHGAGGGLTRGGRVPEDGRRDAGVLLPRHPPFFIFAGELMLHGGIAERIVIFAR